MSFVFSVSFSFSPDSTVLEVSKFTEKGDIGNDLTFLIGLELGTSLKTSGSSFHVVSGTWVVKIVYCQFLNSFSSLS